MQGASCLALLARLAMVGALPSPWLPEGLVAM